MTKIGIVVGSVREGRVGDQIGNWILEQARAAHPEAPSRTPSTPSAPS